MKINRNGQAKIFTLEEDRRFNESLDNPRDNAIFSICRFTGCRISEALTLFRDDITDDHIIFRKCNTKGKIETREVPIHPTLRAILDEWLALPPEDINSPYLFTSPYGRKPVSKQWADKKFRAVCKKAGIKGASTHSFRRTALTRMSNAGVPLRHIQKISGHHSLEQLQRYLEVSEENKIQAISVL